MVWPKVNNIAGVSSPGEIISNGPGETGYVMTDSVPSLGNIDLYNGSINAGGDLGGTVFIRGGKLMMDNASIYTSTKGTNDTSSVAGIDIELNTIRFCFKIWEIYRYRCLLCGHCKNFSNSHRLP